MVRGVAKRGQPDHRQSGLLRLGAHANPVCILVEAKAKRAVVQKYERALENRCAHPDGLASAGALLAPLGAIQLLALPYARHPDTSPDWAPND